MELRRVVEYAFFFLLLLGAGYMVWRIVAPFLSAIALATIIVVICYPLFERMVRYMPRQSRNLAALLTTVLVIFAIVLPISLVSSVLVRDAVTFYQNLEARDLPLESYVESIEIALQAYVPGFELNLSEQIRQSAQWLTGNIGVIFAGTLSTLFFLFIALIGTFYFFRDGREFIKILVKASPLPETKDLIIVERLGTAVRALVLGTVLVALIQGTLAAIGFTIFGVPQAVLWGSVAALGALVPGIGTTIIMLPAILYLFFTGEAGSAIGLALWGATAVGSIDNFLGPYLMSRGSRLHPFIILIAALGGVALMGPIGFIIGPVAVVLFMVLLEIYHQYIATDAVVVKPARAVTSTKLS